MRAAAPSPGAAAAHSPIVESASRVSSAGRGDQRRLVPEHAGPGELDAELLDLVAGRVQEVDAAEAVDLEVDEPGDRDPGAASRARPTAAIVPFSISTSPRTSDPSTTAAATPSFTAIAYGPPSERRRGTGSLGSSALRQDSNTVTRPSPFDLTGRCAVVTGASSGIGQAIATRARRGRRRRRRALARRWRRDGCARRRARATERAAHRRHERSRRPRARCRRRRWSSSAGSTSGSTTPPVRS